MTDSKFSFSSIRNMSSNEDYKLYVQNKVKDLMGNKTELTAQEAFSIFSKLNTSLNQKDLNGIIRAAKADGNASLNLDEMSAVFAMIDGKIGEDNNFHFDGDITNSAGIAEKTILNDGSEVEQGEVSQTIKQGVKTYTEHVMDEVRTLMGGKSELSATEAFEIFNRHNKNLGAETWMGIIKTANLDGNDKVNFVEMCTIYNLLDIQIVNDEDIVLNRDRDISEKFFSQKNTNFLEYALEDENLLKDYAKTYISELGLQESKYISEPPADISYQKIPESLQPDGVVGSFKQNEIGDCWFLAQINALSGTDFGKQAIKDSIQKNEDGSYTVKIKGADKEFTITQEDLFNAMKKGVYSKGDMDVLLLELAFEKYFDAQGDRVYGENLSSLTGGQSDDKIIELLSGAKKYAFSGDMAEQALLLMSDNPEKIAVVYSSSYDIESGGIFETSGGHVYNVTSVTKDENGNVSDIVSANPWYNKVAITKSYESLKPMLYSDNEKVVKGATIADFNIFAQDEGMKAKLDVLQRRYYADVITQTSTDTFDIVSAIRAYDSDDAAKAKLVDECGGFKVIFDRLYKLAESEAEQYDITDKSKIKEDWISSCWTCINPDKEWFSEPPKELLENPEKLQEYCEKAGLKY